MIPLQITAVLFGLLMMYVVRIHYGKGHLGHIEYVCWLLIWTGFIFTAIFPNTFHNIAETLNIARVFDLLIMLGLMALTFFTFHNRVEVKKFEGKLEDVIRKRAISTKRPI